MQPRTRGLDELGRALAALAGEPGQSVVQFAANCSLPRSSAFALVKHLENSGIVERDASGLIWPGSGAAALGFGAMGISGLEGPADALVCSLCEEIDATVRLTAGGTVLVTRRASWDRRVAVAGPIVDTTVAGRACLSVSLRPGASEADVCEARSCLQRTAQALSDFLAAGKAPEAGGAAADASAP